MNCGRQEFQLPVMLTLSCTLSDPPRYLANNRIAAFNSQISFLFASSRILNEIIIQRFADDDLFTSKQCNRDVMTDDAMSNVNKQVGAELD